MLSSTTSASAKNYNNTSIHNQQLVFLELISYIKINPGFVCLDIGCGTGNNTALLADWVGENGHIVGIDPDEKRIEIAVQNYKHIANLEFVIAKSIDFPLCDEGYDVIISNVVMHWIKYDEKIETYKRVFKALKPGGVFVSDEVSKRTEIILNFLAFAPKDARDKINSSIFCINAEKNREIFTNLGFEIIRLEEVTYNRNLQSLDSCFNWIDATLYGIIDSKMIYYQNKGKVNLKINEDGTVRYQRYGNQIIVKKPM